MIETARSAAGAPGTRPDSERREDWSIDQEGRLIVEATASVTGGTAASQVLRYRRR